MGRYPPTSLFAYNVSKVRKRLAILTLNSKNELLMFLSENRVSNHRVVDMEFQPDPRLRTKYYLQLFTLPLFFFLIIVLPLAVVIYLLFQPSPWLTWFWVNILLWGFLFCFIWTIPGLFAIPIYYRQIRYEIGDDEVIVSRGVITLTRRVVPVRAITNVSLRRGPYDRALGIGSVKIETAGQMGAQSGTPSPELALDGLMDYEKIYHRILELVRRYRSGYALTTEIEKEPIEDTSFLLQKILFELQKLNKKMEPSKR
jgi:membrane protein YdbS with pleckstrin-like domain